MGQGSSQPERRGEGSGQSRRRPTARLSSQPELIGDGQLRPLSPVRRSPQPEMIEAGQSTGRPVGRPRGANARPRPRSIYRFSQLLRNHSGSSNPNDEEGQQGLSGGSDEHSDSSRTGRMVERTRSTFRHMLGRGESSRDVRHPRIGPPFWPRQGEPFIPQRASYHGPAPPPHAGAEELRSSRRLPDTWPIHDELSAIDFQPITPVATQQPVRLSGLRSERSGIARRLTSFRRRRSAQPEIRRLDGNDDQAIMLSRLLSVAAAATAATLMGDDNNALGGARSLADGTSVGEYGGGGEDGSFDGFLRSLQNGRIASALRAGTDPEAGPSDAAGPPAPLNFFRMFRFGTSNAPSAAANAPANGSDGRNSEGDSRMVPIIIVGIRSISPNTAAASDDSEHPLPPFMDALGGFPSPVPAHALGQHAHDSIDSILRPPQNGTSFRHRRRASMGAFGMSRNRLSDRMDDQRDHRSPDRRRERPWSMASANSAFEPRPPHVTPASASPELSRISSRQTTPNESRRASFIANSMRELTEDSRRNSLLRRSTGPSPLSSHTEETLSLHSTHSGTNLLSPPSPDAAASTSAAAGSAADHHNLHNSTTATHRRSDANPNIHYPRFASGHPRRNGVVEPDNLPPLSRASTSNATDDAASGTNTTNDHSSDREGGGGGRNSADATDSRSWIIYVLGGSYPEDHPILTTPSLFTENPTYEDMMLLSALLGPAKAPVASEEDVQSAGGLYTTEIVGGSASASSSEAGDAAKTAQLVAVATDESPRATAAVHGNAEERVYLELGQRCLVCLCEFEPAESVRKLVKCEHLFHRECIDQWLTQGRNSCPLCRGLGVNETEKAAVDPAASSASASASASSSSATTAGAARSAGNAETTASVRNSAVSSDFEDWHVLPA